MLLIPYDQAILKTSLTVEEVYQKLAEVIEPRKYFHFTRDHAYFEGSLDKTQFKISRIIHYRNSFLPVIMGELRDELDKTAVILRMRLNWFVIVFLLIFTFMFGGMTIFIMIGQFPNDEIPWIQPVFLLLFFHTLAILFFHWEARKAKTYLQEVLQVGETAVSPNTFS